MPSIYLMDGFLSILTEMINTNILWGYVKLSAQRRGLPGREVV